MEFETREDGRIACPFNHHTADYADRYPEILDELRERAPLAWSDSHGGYWVATSHSIVRKLAMDSAAFTVAPGPERTGGIRIPPSQGAKHRPLFVPGETDGETHDNYRLALNPLFTRQKVAGLAPMIDRHISRTFDRILEHEEFDVLHDLMHPILSGIGCEYLGLDVEDPGTFIREVERIVSYAGNDLESVKGRFEGAWAQILEIVQAKRVDPGDDVISHLVRRTSPAFTDEEVQMMTLNVILGSSDTTSTLISQAIAYMDQHPEVRARLAANPDLLIPAIDEFLRLISPAMNVGRTATRDYEVDGVTIREGDRIMLSWTAANHDPERYPNPYEFDLERGAKQHLGMGVGAHFCLGRWMATSIAARTLEELFRRAPNYHVDLDRAERPAERSQLNRWLSMPAHTS